MNNNDLKLLLEDLDNSIDSDLRVLFKSSSVYPIFSMLVRLSVLDDASFDDEVIALLDNLTDSLDSLNFDDSKILINNIIQILDN